MNLNFLKLKTDDRAIKEAEESYGEKHDGSIDRIVRFNLWCDFAFRYIVAGFIFWIVLKNYFYIHDIMILKNVQENLGAAYIKYSVIFNSALLLVLGYWFSHNGSSSLLREELKAVASRKLAKMMDKKNQSGTEN